MVGRVERDPAYEDRYTQKLDCISFTNFVTMARLHLAEGALRVVPSYARHARAAGTRTLWGERWRKKEYKLLSLIIVVLSYHQPLSSSIKQSLIETHARTWTRLPSD